MESEKMYIWNNPDFNEVIIFHELEAVSFRSQEKAKILGGEIKTQFQKIQCDNWPYNKPIMVAIGISGQKRMYSRKDVDNMCKVILDAGNKIVYKDDRLIHILLVQKQLWKLQTHGICIGLRVIETDKRDKYSPQIFVASARSFAGG